MTIRKNNDGVSVPLQTFSKSFSDLDQQDSVPSTASSNMDRESLPTTAASMDQDTLPYPEDVSDSELDQETERLFRLHDTKFNNFKRFLQYVWDGPTNPRDDYAPGFKSLESIDRFPEKFNSKYPRFTRIALLSAYVFLWAVYSYSILMPYFTKVPVYLNDPEVPILSLSCLGQVHWNGKNAACGLNGELCDPPEQDVIIRCPALCDRSWTYSLIPIGDQRIKHRGYFIGGGDHVEDKIDDNQLSNPYRMDSYPCGAAVHAGIVSPFYGGCARVSYKTKTQYRYPAASGHYGVGKSIEFLSFFKNSFFFRALTGGDTEGYVSHCYDPRLLILVSNFILGIPIVYMASPATMYWILNIVGFWTICLATDPPVTVDASRPERLAELISIGLERFLPSCFVLYVLWHASVKRTLSNPPPESDSKASPLNRLLIWYPPFWLGVLNNISFDRLSVDRLTLHDLKEQPGSIFAVGSIILLILVCAVIQAYKIWLSGRFRKYIVIYLSFVVGLVFLSTLPGLTLRIHHYILAMLLIPGCSTRGRTALLFQGVLGGLFLSGASRWGLAAIAETVGSLLRDDPVGSIIPPDILSYDPETGLMTWTEINFETLTPSQRVAYGAYKSVSVLINDVERYIATNVTSVNLKELFESSTELLTDINESLKHGYKDAEGNILLYIRIGRRLTKEPEYSDFTNSAVLKWPSGNFTLPAPGIS